MLGSRTWAPALLAALLGAAACAPDPGAAAPLRVLGAASLREGLAGALAAIEAGGGPAAVASFAGSQTLVLQVREGIGADVVALADPALLDALHAEGRVETPRAFARNRLVWISALDARGRPRLPLARLGVDTGRVVLAAPSVPAGRYAHEALAALGRLEAAHERLVSRELDVRAVLAKVVAGEADAGAVYATDAATVAGRLHVEPLPGHALPPIVYAAAVIADSARIGAARDLVERLAGAPGCAALAAHGFSCGAGGDGP